MTYDPEKYRSKREKVLGIKKRSIGFGTLAAIVAACILSGLGMVAVPEVVSYVSTRNLDDAIFRLENRHSWPGSAIDEIKTVPGVRSASADHHGLRLVVTFDRTLVMTDTLSALFTRHGLSATLLNRTGHRQRMATLKEEAENEAL